MNWKLGLVEWVPFFGVSAAAGGFLFTGIEPAGDVLFGLLGGFGLALACLGFGFGVRYGRRHSLGGGA